MNRSKSDLFIFWNNEAEQLKYFRIFILSMFTIFMAFTSHANEIDSKYHHFVQEQPNYEKFKENLKYLFEFMWGHSGLHREQELQVEFIPCIHQQQMVKMLNSNQKFQTEFDREYAEHGKTYMGMLQDFEASVQEMKSYCDQVTQAEHVSES